MTFSTALAAPVLEGMMLVAAARPPLCGWAVDGLLGSGVGVYGGHEAFEHGELVMDDLGQRSQTICSAGGVGDNLNIGLVRRLIDAHHVHGGISGGGRDDDLLSTTL
jgi:hypothetical protein